MEKLRDDIDESPHRLKRALMSDGLRRDFFKGAKDENAVITQFVGINAASALKTKPKVRTLPKLNAYTFIIGILGLEADINEMNRATKPTTKISNCCDSKTSQSVGS
jgi:hypothetical protein